MASRLLIRDAIRSLDKVGAKVLGVVVNAVDPSRRRGNYYYYHYYGYNYAYNRYYSDPPVEGAAKKSS
jgi:Mrp family chromosome partitioning ATPase